jgi:hypothetical protein
MQSAPTDKLLKPPRGGGESKEKSGFRSAKRCLRSLSRQIPAIQMKFPEEDMVFISKSDRLLDAEKSEIRISYRGRRPTVRQSETNFKNRKKF